MDRIVIIGAGQAGVQAVVSLRGAGFAGPIAMVGDEPFPPYQRPPLSKAYLSGDLARERLFLKPEAFYREVNCDLHVGMRAAGIDRADRRVHLAQPRAHGWIDEPYSRLLICTGTRPRRLSVPGAELPGIHYLRGIEDVDALRPAIQPGMRLVIVGAGYIGLEVAAVAKKLGLDVTVLEAEARVMPRTASEAVSDFYEQVHHAAGVKLMFGAAAQAFEGQGNVLIVRTSHGDVPADVVLVGIGVVPNDEIARDAGIACDNGILVDEFGRTSDPNVFAAGDCTNHPWRDGSRGRLESVQNAIDQAKHTAQTMAGNPTPYREVPWFWSDQYDLKLQSAGIARPGDTIVVRGNPASRKFAAFHLRDGRVAAVEAINAPPEYIVGRKLIADGARIDPARLADTSVSMKEMA